MLQDGCVTCYSSLETANHHYFIFIEKGNILRERRKSFSSSKGIRRHLKLTKQKGGKEENANVAKYEYMKCDLFILTLTNKHGRNRNTTRCAREILTPI